MASSNIIIFFVTINAGLCDFHSALRLTYTSDRQFSSNVDFFCKSNDRNGVSNVKKYILKKLNIGGEMAVLRFGRK